MPGESAGGDTLRLDRCNSSKPESALRSTPSGCHDDVVSGLFALLDDVAAMVKLTASSLDDIAASAGRASIKAAGVVVDDAAVTPRYVQGLKPERELSIIWRIAKGSIRNKLLIILPVALLLSQFAPFLLTASLMVGGTYLCYEGAEKIWEKFSGHAEEEAGAADAAAGARTVDP